MKAILYTKYGSPDVLHLGEVDTPKPKDNEIMIKIHATPVNFGDITVRNIKEKMTLRKFWMPTPFWLLTRLEFGFNKPKRSKTVLGSDLAGEVTVTGKDVTRFKAGDRVFAYRSSLMGGNAEYICVPENSIVAHMPSNMSFAEAATIPYGTMTALNLLRKANIQKGQKILINGASGSIGSAATQLAKYYGAEVTGVCSAPKMEFVKTLGADKVIDYIKNDFTKNGETYDLILDVLGKSSFAACKNSLTQNGLYLLATFKTRHLLPMLWSSIKGGKRMICALSNEKTDGLVHIKELIEAGSLKTVIDKSFSMGQAAEAHRYVESGQNKGNVIIIIG